MLALVRPFIELCLLRIGPQDLPASGLLLAVVLATHLLGSVINAVFYAPIGKALFVGIADTALTVALVTVTLAVQRLNDRILQTVTAYAGAGALLQIIALPLTGWIVATRTSGGDPSALRLLSYGLLFWSWAVAAHVLRHALSVRFAAGLAVAVLYFLISINVMHVLFPELFTPAPANESPDGR